MTRGTFRTWQDITIQSVTDDDARYWELECGSCGAVEQLASEPEALARVVDHSCVMTSVTTR